MGSHKDATPDPLAIEVSFDCPTPACGEMIETSVQASIFDSKLSENGLGYTRTAVQCPACKGTFTLEVIADAKGQLMKVENFPEIEVWFDDGQPFVEEIEE